MPAAAKTWRENIEVHPIGSGEIECFLDVFDAAIATLSRLWPRRRMRAPRPRLPPPIDGSGGAAHGRVPRTIKVESAYGRVHLDLSRAIIEHPIVDIELQLAFKGAKITVPRDAIVDIEDLRTVWKDTLYKTPRHSRARGPRIRISGTMGYGRLKIRHASR